MAMHIQDQILGRLKEIIAAASIVEAGRVLLEGVDEIPAAAAPTIKIDCGPEAVETLTLAFPRTLRRTLDVYIFVVVAQNADFRLRAGDLLARLERALYTPEGRALANDIRLIATDPDRDGNAAQVTYTIRTLWRL